jgi:hypothetical protein
MENTEVRASTPHVEVGLSCLRTVNYCEALMLLGLGTIYIEPQELNRYL